MTITEAKAIMRIYERYAAKGKNFHVMVMDKPVCSFGKAKDAKLYAEALSISTGLPTNVFDSIRRTTTNEFSGENN